MTELEKGLGGARQSRRLNKGWTGRNAQKKSDLGLRDALDFKHRACMNLLSVLQRYKCPPEAMFYHSSELHKP